jgi:hypothetical protein
MEGIHEAAWHGNLKKVNRMLKKDMGRLNALVEDEHAGTDDCSLSGAAPLIVASYTGREAVVERLLALGADVGMGTEHGAAAAHVACIDDHSSILARLLDAGAPINASSTYGWTVLMEATLCCASKCLKLLLDRGGHMLELDATNRQRETALCIAVERQSPKMVRLLVEAGADPTIGKSMDSAQDMWLSRCSALLKAAHAEPQRPRLLFKARRLLDAARSVTKARKDAAVKGLSAAVQQEKALAAAPAYLHGRVVEGQELPRPALTGKNKKRLAVLRFALGMDDGDGSTALPPESFTELLEMMAPRWDPAHKGVPIGEGVDWDVKGGALGKQENEEDAEDEDLLAMLEGMASEEEEGWM